MAQPAIPLPEKLERVKVLAAESTRMNSQLLAEALAQDCRLDVMGIEPNQTLILAAVAQEKPQVVLISSSLEDSGTQGFDLARQISARRAAIRDNFAASNRAALEGYDGDRAALYARLKLAGLDQAPNHLAVFADRETPAGHGLGRRIRMERRQDEMARERGFDRDSGRLSIAHLADHDDVRIRTQKGAHRMGEREVNARIDLYLS